jgi:hypothetical protein
MKRQLCLFLATVGAACSGGSTDPSASSVVSRDGPHRAQPVACGVSVGPSGRDPTNGMPLDLCVSDGDCNPGGVLGPPYPAAGRCILFQGSHRCTYDQCQQDADCAMGGVCSCQGQSRGWSAISPGNVCVTANCRTDADCADTHDCSPSVGFDSGPFYGVGGYSCHTKEDRCGKDADCPSGQSCAFQSQAGVWACSSARVAG